MSQTIAVLRALYPNGHHDFIDLCLEEMKLHSEKNADYAREGDPLGNFKRVSEILNLWGVELPSYAVAWVYLMKQVDAVGRMIGLDYDGQVEGIMDKLRDISVYVKLVEILYVEEKKNAGLS